jgi:hypothetical protein
LPKPEECHGTGLNVELDANSIPALAVVDPEAAKKGIP